MKMTSEAHSGAGSDMQDSDLDDLLATARSAAPVPSAALLARIEADALGHLPRSDALIRGSKAPRRGLRRLIEDFVLAVGGLGGAAGLASAALAGLWIGIAQPQGLSTLAEGLSARLGTETTLDSVELIPALDLFASEG